jgi:RNase P subunit RPR2
MRRWFARNYEISRIATNFTGALSHRLNTLRSNAMNVPRVVCPECGKRMRLAVLEPYPAVDTRKETTTFICECGERFSYTVGPHL